jgi:LysM repeat protein
MARITIASLVAVLGALSLDQAASAAVTYVVRPGETLAKIAREHFGSESQWREIARANGIRPPYAVKVGQRLTLPDAPAAAATATPTASPDSIAVAKSFSAPPTCGTTSKESKTSPTFGGFFIAAIGAFVLAGIVGLIGFIVFEVAAFRESFWWGIGTLFIQPVWIVFLVRHWEKARRGFIMQIVASVLALPGLALLMLCGTEWR